MSIFVRPKRNSWKSIFLPDWQISEIFKLGPRAQFLANRPNSFFVDHIDTKSLGRNHNLANRGTAGRELRCGLIPPAPLQISWIRGRSIYRIIGCFINTGTSKPCTQKECKKGGHGVYKSKLLHSEDTQKDFGSKKILWPGPEGLEVGPAENFGALKSGFFYFGLKFWPLN